MLLNTQASTHMSPRKPSLKLLLMLPVLAGFAFLIRVPLSWIDQATFSGILIVACIVMGRLSDSRLVTSTLAIASVFCTLRYIVWRWSSSITYLNSSGWNVDLTGLIFALLLLCAETYAVIILLLGYFQSARPLKRKPIPMPADISLWPSVDVFIPTYN